jgi:molybdenum cofactor guanylyltransferase
MSASPPPSARLATAILAGGRAHRLGGINKAALRIGDRRIVDRQIALLRNVADNVFIVSDRAELFTDLGVRVVNDLLPGAGALGGIHAAIAQSPAERTIVVACDMPFLSMELLRRLARPSDADVVIPRTARGYEPLCAAWSAVCAEPIRRRIERGALKAALVLEDLRVEEIGPDILASCDPYGLLFVNVNTAHDYERAQELSDLESDG